MATGLPTVLIAGGIGITPVPAAVAATGGRKRARDVDADVLRRHLPQDLASYQFLLGGPPAMIESLHEELLEAGVPEARIRQELFAT
ncbi:hypothetical protein [Aestuariimicrobium ganziense]|uniref:hypothetical protein n=1 Tax=Aestuariimicrobium ganziense TaxID=2773677 RepID=UPI0019447F65|nr:hypothetical protein [Aestuariimicrobium ganziense]